MRFFHSFLGPVEGPVCCWQSGKKRELASKLQRPQRLCFIQVEGWQRFIQRLAMLLVKGDFVDLNRGVCYVTVGQKCKDTERANGF